MAQTGSAQREPSMEEILASIRRIIEDSDTVRQPGDEDVLPASGGTGDEVEAFRAELEEPATSVAQPVSMAEIQASVAYAEEAGTEHEPAAEAGALPETTVFQEADAMPFDDAAENAPATQEPTLGATLPEPVEAQARPAIISDQAGRQVAAAFGELSEAFAASRRRSFDEMAEEMLRPMLQDWLDNNLPTLVEKLVREEIERVARGS